MPLLMACCFAATTPFLPHPSQQLLTPPHPSPQCTSRAAAKAALGEEMSAAIAAISTVAAWRLDRGIWTSPGAGDIRRATAAASRLVMLLHAAGGVGANADVER
jgi:hypothetical protein